MNTQKGVILILIDGMRADAFMTCSNDYAQKLLKESAYTLEAKTVLPSVTLPCHMSLFLSVPPERHGVLTNTYVPQVRPVDGLCERLNFAGKKCAFFYNWEQLRDLSRPGMMSVSFMCSETKEAETDRTVTDCAIACIEKYKPDFTFLYLGETDDAGHRFGWMSEEYLCRLSAALDCVKEVVEKFGNGYTVILCADHGGHDRTHGSDMKEDVTIPVIMRGDMFAKGQELNEVSILDIAPTIADLMGATPASEWEGKSLIDHGNSGKIRS